MTSDDADPTSVWGYVRLSQDGRDDTIKEQKEKLRDYCRRRDDVRLVTTLSDGKYTSGFSADRDAFQTIRKKLRDDEIDGVVVRDRARLARDFDIRVRLLLTMREHDVELHVTENRGPVDIHDVQQAAFETMKAAMDHVAKKAEMERARHVVAQRLDAGEYQGRPWTGTEFDDDSRYLKPAENDEWDAVMEVVEAWDGEEGSATKAGLARQTGLSRSAVRRVIDRLEEYEALADGARIGHEGQTVWPARANGGQEAGGAE